MKELVFVLSKKDLNFLETIRAYNNIKIAEDNDLLWVRYFSEIEELDKKIKKLPIKNRYKLDKKDNIFPIEKITPIGNIKNLQWFPINEYINIEIPNSLMSGIINQKYETKIIKSNFYQESSALITDFSTFINYIEIASEIRFKHLIFSLSNDNRVIIIGNPLPPIKGNEYWLKNNILIPCGYNFEIPIISSIISKKENLENNAFLLVNINNVYEKIQKENFVPVTRSSVRLSNINSIDIF